MLQYARHDDLAVFASDESGSDRVVVLVALAQMGIVVRRPKDVDLFGRRTKRMVFQEKRQQLRRTTPDVIFEDVNFGCHVL